MSLLDEHACDGRGEWNAAPTSGNPSAEQQARDMLERMGVEDAQSWSAGELVELANLIADRHRMPTSGNDEVDARDFDIDAVCSVVDNAGKSGNMQVWLAEDVIACIRKQSAQIEHLGKVLASEQAKNFQYEAEKASPGLLVAQIAELQKATAQTSASPTPADSAARPETE